MSLSGINTLTANLSMMVQSILGLIGTISFHVISIQLACAISAVCYYIMILNTVLPMIGLRPLLEPKDTVGKTGSCHHCSGRLLVVAIAQMDLMVPTHLKTANVLQLSSRGVGQKFQVPRACILGSHCLQVTGDTGSKTDVETKLDAQPSLHTVNITAVSASPSEIRP